MLLASQDPEIPKNPVLAEGQSIDEFNYRYYKENYLKHVDFGDERLLRSPVLHNKLDYYIKKLTVQIPDSINVAADYLTEKARANKEVFKYVVHHITNTYEKSNVMGMDAVFVHMAENYYLTGDAYWIDSARTEKIRERATSLKPLLLGKVTPNIILPDTGEKNWVNLHEIKAKYTILYFWDSHCGHCKKSTPKLHEYYKANKSLGIEVYAVGTELKAEDWKKFIREHKLDWINVSDTPEINKNAYDYILSGKTTLNSLNFRDIYDIYSTPVMIVLDKDKKIIAKKLGVEQLEEFINDLEKKAEN
jgi:peroxiredoxin